jgi:iron(III) transport system permease protein
MTAVATGAHTVRRPRHGWHLVGAGIAAGVVLLPVLSILLIAFDSDGSDWPHLIRNVLPSSTATTLSLLCLVTLGTGIVGVAAAWLIVSFEFPLRRILSWALVLPLAVPTYLAAYAFGEFFHFTGPVQSLYRWLFGYVTPRDYWFPDIRSLGGVALVLTCVLYPYVYMTTRVLFLMQGRDLADVARTLGAGTSRVLFRVLLPVSRPAIVAGLALVLMETLNDIGAAEYLGVRTLTFSVYSTWLGRGSLAGGAQIALVLLVLVVLLLAAERWARRRQRFHNSRATTMRRHQSRRPLGGARGIWAAALLSLPVLMGFGIPLLVFGRYALRRYDNVWSPELADALLTTIATGFITALLTSAIALFLLNAVRLARSSAMAATVRLASTGYALPGGIVGLGLLFALASIDNAVDSFARAYLGVSTGLLLTGSMMAVVIGCTVRFIALAEGSIRSGLEKLPANIDEAARSLGQTANGSARLILLPLLRPAVLTAAVLVFVDTVKELSATILLRPFGFNTLATYVYENASRGAPEDGAFAALLIIATALAPVLLLSRSLARDRADA